MSDPWTPYYPEGVTAECVPPAGTLVDLLERAATRNPGAPALVFQDQVMTYHDLWRATLASASLLGPGGGRIVVALPNEPAFAAVFFGALYGGHTVVPVSGRLSVPEVEAVVTDAEPDVLVVPPALEPAYRDLLACHPHSPIPRILVVDGVPVIGASPPPPRAESRATDVAVLQYTSGTTGGLKAAMMTHQNLVANAHQNNSWFGWHARDVVAGVLPLCHTWGLSCVLIAAISAGASIVLFESADPASVVAGIERHQVSIVYGSATLFDRLLDAAGAGKAFASCRYVKAGAMLVGGRLPQRWATAVPGVPMELGYGLTEASPEVCNNPPGRHKAGTVGVPLPGTKVRITSPEDPGIELGINTVGEIQVRGPQVMAGYWKRPAETAAALTRDGWLRTGDLGRMDAEGYLTIVDRLKDLIKFRGWSVVPAEVERVLAGHPDVAEAVVVGVPHATDGEVPVACVVASSSMAPDPEALDAFVASRLAPYKRPRAYRFVAAIPRNAVGKPLRRSIRDEWSETSGQESA